MTLSAMDWGLQNLKWIKKFNYLAWMTDHEILQVVRCHPEPEMSETTKENGSFSCQIKVRLIVVLVVVRFHPLFFVGIF